MSTNQTNATNNQTALAGQASSTTACPPINLADAVFAMDDLRQFISFEQRSVLKQMVNGEERKFFRKHLVDLAKTVSSMPTTYQTDGQGDQAVAVLHYFTSDCDWYITERDCLEEQHQAFGLACIYEQELGYINIAELIEAGAELDLHWTPKTLGQVKAERLMSDVNYTGHPMHY